MKKLMIAAAIVCAAALAQAASIDWSCSEQVMKANYSKAYDLTQCSAYLIEQSVWEGFTKTAADQQTYANFSALAKADQKGITVTSGDFKDAATSKYGASSSAEVASGYFYVIIANESVGYYASSLAEGTAYDHNASPLPSHKDPALSIAMNKTPLGTSSFTTFAVPEPTSGLLLLLGMAGLALRRRRA